MMYEVRG